MGNRKGARSSNPGHPEVHAVDGLAEGVFLVHGDDESAVAGALAKRGDAGILGQGVRDLSREAFDEQSAALADTSRPAFLG